uniref:YheU family protein n=1 Tax=Pseudomonas aeruginosa TaxID=287 RepID=UPI0039B6EFF1
MLIPHDLLEADTLNNLLEDFVTREGTDNGDETPLDVRVERARHALRRGGGGVLFAPGGQAGPWMVRSGGAGGVFWRRG